MHMEPLSVREARKWVLDAGPQQKGAAVTDEHILKTLHAFNTLGYMTLEGSITELVARMANTLKIGQGRILRLLADYLKEYPIQEEPPDTEVADLDAGDTARPNEAYKKRDSDWGDYVRRLYIGGDGEHIHIWGYLPPLDEIIERERQLGAEDEEVESIRQSLTEAHARGYRYGRFYSVIEPDGELGSAHDTNLFVITKEEFDLAKASGWQPTAPEVNWPHGSFSTDARVIRS